MDSIFGYNPPKPPAGKKRSNEVNYNKNPTKIFKRIEGKAWESAIERLSTNPIEARIWVAKSAYDGSLTWRRLPLHEACIRKPPARLLQKLIQTYPKAAAKPDSDGRLPLHHACANNASIEVVQQILFVYPESLEATDASSKTPMQTLMATYFPDPHVISALKKGVDHYRTQAGHDGNVPTIQMTSSSDSHDISVQYANSNSYQKGSRRVEYNSQGSVSDSGSSQIPRGASQVNRHALNKDQAMTSALESEIGRFSEKLASSMNNKSSMQNRIQLLESEINRLLSTESENGKLKNMIGDLENELRSVRDNYERERSDMTRDLRMLDDMKRSEERLQRQIEDMNRDPRPRMLEEKVASLTDALNDKESRHEMEVQSLKHSLRQMEEEVNTSRSMVNQMENENNRLNLDLKKKEYQVDAQRETEQGMRDQLNDTKHAAREMELLQKRCQDQDMKINDLSQKMNLVDDENNNLRRDRAEFSLLQNEFRDHGVYTRDLEDKLHRADDEIGRISNQNRMNEQTLQELKDSASSEKKKLDQEVEELRDDLKITTRDKVDVESRLDLSRMSLRQATQERDDLTKREIEITLELNKLQRALNSKISDYKSKVADEQLKVATSADRLKTMEEEVMKLRAVINNTSSANAEAMMESLKLQKAAKENEYMKNSLEREKEELMKRISSIESERDEYKNKSFELHTKQSQLEQGHNYISSKNRLLLSEKEYLDKEVTSLKLELDSWKAKMSVSVLKEKDIMSRLEHAEREKDMIGRETKIIQQSAHKAGEGRVTIEADMKALQLERNAILKRNKNLEEDLSEIRGQVSLMEIEIGKLREFNGIANNDRNEETSKLREEKEQADLKVESLVKDNSQLEKELWHLRMKSSHEVSKEINELRDQKERCVIEMKALTTDNLQLEKEVSNLRSEVELQVGSKVEYRGSGNARGQDQELVDAKNAIIGVLNEEATAMIENLEDVQRENAMLRALLSQEEDKSQYSNSIGELEERLVRIEEEKDAIINHLMEERDALTQEVSRLKASMSKLESDLDRIQDGNYTVTTEIGKLKKLRDMKKQHLTERLAAYETRSCAGSVVSHKRRVNMEQNSDTMSTVSGVTMTSYSVVDKRSEDLDKVMKWKSKYAAPSHQSTSSWSPAARLDRKVMSTSSHRSRSRRESSALSDMFPAYMSVSGLSISERSERTRPLLPSVESRVPPAIVECRNEMNGDRLKD
eukprot:CAMPEP_0194076938 /NCGR_PEP_ID=MMETSP0149-20130528/3662_1 /TAXON_ID=122233 /ORGANISM="Chaetoceros debilis, Strain MM31A-1" /LENGTH=1214 /DNA_ID=CAMNT_0038757825 /DNA_START=225 /DNA_END=3869 /DNA_ORIENTATION=-